LPDGRSVGVAIASARDEPGLLQGQPDQNLGELVQVGSSRYSARTENALLIARRSVFLT
jgi:hypothetical protein